MQQTVSDKAPGAAWFHRFPRAAPLALFVLAIATTLLLVMSIESTAATERSALLERNATEFGSAIQRRAAESVAYLTAASALVAHDRNLSDDEFSDFVADLDAAHAERGTMGMGYARLRSDATLPQLASELRARGIAVRAPDGSPVGPAPRHLVITVLTPPSPANRRALGVDMYAEPVRRQAIDAAIATGKVTLTEPITLVQDGGTGHGGFIMYAPPARDPLRAAGGGGLVYTPVRTREFVASALEPLGNRNLDWAVYDGAELIAGAAIGNRDVATVQRPVRVGNRTWSLVVAETAPARLGMLSALIIGLGVALALALLLATHYVIRSAIEDRRVLDRLTREEAMRRTLTRELNHRVKNALANVLSIISLTRRGKTDIDAFVDGVAGRIRALSATHDILSQREWSNAPVVDVVRSEVAPYLDGGSEAIRMEGPAIMLAPNDALSLGLALHELATNAAKYGALSQPGGKVRIDWKLLTPTLAQLRWREVDGPTVAPPERRGFGLDLLEKIVAHELRNAIDLQFRPTGVECTIRIPVRRPGEFALHSRAGA